MSSSSQHPTHEITVSLYLRLLEFLIGFAQGAFGLMILLGAPGLGKSRMVREALKDVAHLYFDSNVTPYMLYLAMYMHRDVPIVLDDLDPLLAHPQGTALLKAIGSTEKVKTVQWFSKAPDIGYGDGQVPPRYDTRSPVILIANDISTFSRNVAAVRDRGINITFKPPVEEVHREVGTWFDDPEVFAFIDAFLPVLPALSMRHYIHGASLRQQMPNTWQDRLAALLGIDEKILRFVEIMRDESIGTEEEKAALFTKLGLGDRATYFRWKKKWRDAHGGVVV